MKSTMMNYQLIIPAILRRASEVHPEKEIVTKMNDESIHRYTYGEFSSRVKKLIDSLQKLGIRPGDRIATFGMNHYRHLEIYFAVPSMGAILHTLNVRLFPEQLVFIVNDAEDSVIFVDKSLGKILLDLLSQFKKKPKFIIMDDLEATEPAALPDAIDYETFLKNGSKEVALPELDENQAAGMCYTSGTTGNPKGVVYSHRSIYLHSMSICMSDSLGICEKETVLPVVPMFHANAWGIPFACVMTGAVLVFPGKHLLGHGLASLLEQEKVSIAAGVPTIWNVLYQHLKKNSYDLGKLHTMIVGGSAAPQSMIEGFKNDFGIHILHAWGMTELSPVGTVCRLRTTMSDRKELEKMQLLAKQGPAVAGVELKGIDDQGKDIPKDGKTPGELIVRGPWITASYYGNPSKESFTEDGWFRTGDVITIDEHGYIQITDRKKDLIKTRGEWISSVEMESYVLKAPGVLEAAVVAKPDEIRGEVPVVFVVAKEGEKVDKKSVLDILKENFANWQLPHSDDIRLIEAIPKTSVGKFDKKVLRSGINSGKY
ncbi:long-chain fatty acid--CoA ligase [Leptospira borgpetersenii]|uniref:long-chain fatty acid--CoA ligase n=1 Tax=Leptospira borgpetersenii TaxID=174 RepID=UPI002158AD36|nr:long-chain fatty acid--CoA ligase [Leptospira borgpetersenii]UVD73933.1 long-chain fatty acid--CoA ligase [Leptospira borgpetersenii]UVD77126.1 long-chain fatty acid--CoA ligase [Leptospira borgpetersenii]UZW33690.1 long-chain fatty acid--CoA ligase [Leptospira borgpetersenii]